VSDDVLARLQAAKTDEERSWIAQEASLASLDPDVREAVWAVAIPHWVDVAFLAALLGKGEAEVEAFWPRLVALSYVEPFADRGFSVHERTRNLLLDMLWREERDRFRELSRRAAVYCQEQDREEPSWQMEWIYHLLISEPDRGADELNATGRRWQNSPNFAFDRVDALARLTAKHGDAGRLEERGLGWTIFWQAHLDVYYSKYKEARTKLLQLQISKQVDPFLVAYWKFELGYLDLMLDEYAAARERYEEALPIHREIGDQLGEANCIQSLGDVDLMLSEYAAARERYEEALPIYREIGDRRGEVNVMCGLADLDRASSRWSDAEARYREALAYYEATGIVHSQALTHDRLGDTFRGAGDLDAARRHYETALEIFKKIGSPSAERVAATLKELSS
jgi:tetratricopeptide (TPR) repeat protein